MRIFCPKCASSEIEDRLGQPGAKLVFCCEDCGYSFYPGEALIKFTEAIVIAKGLTNPVRRSILLAFRRKPELSPVELSKLLNIDLNKIGYHVKVLNDCDILVMAKQRMVRGYPQSFYRINLHSLGAN